MTLNRERRNKGASRPALIDLGSQGVFVSVALQSYQKLGTETAVVQDLLSAPFT